jgi:uncharacterized protein YdaU (DUF1376 family)
VAEFPALPFFTDAYLADTRHLTTEEHGAYLLLLMCAWRNRGCQLKDNDRMLARIAGLSPAKWKRMKPVLAEFFTVADGLWRQKKLLYVYDTVSKKVARNRENGRRGGQITAARKQQAEAHTEARTEARTEVHASKSPAASEHQAANPSPVANPGSDTSHSASHNASDRPSQPSGPDTKGGPPKAPAQGPPPIKAKGTAKGPSTKTKTKTKTKEKDSSSKSGQPMSPPNLAGAAGKIAAAAGLDPLYMESGAVALWLSAGADTALDIVPTIRRLSDRLHARTGAVPSHLAYYSKAILEARDKRLGAVTAGLDHAQARPPTPPKLAFDTANPQHWRQFLGDPASRFQGDYISQNWRVPPDHAVFKAAPLGPDPRARYNARIPAEIYQIYGPLWAWNMPPPPA